MSLSITPSDTIRKHPTNHSTSKEVHQFAKTPRFLANNPEYTLFYLDVQMHSTPTTVNSPTAKLPLVMAINQTSPKA